MFKRRFPPPWSIDESNNACFIVRDKNVQALGYFYFGGLCVVSLSLVDRASAPRKSLHDTLQHDQNYDGADRQGDVANHYGVLKGTAARLPV